VARAHRLHRRRRRPRGRAPRRPDRGRDAGDEADRDPRERRAIAVILDRGTRLLVQGLTGSEGRFHGLRNRAYGTDVVAGVTPGKGGQDVEGIPVFDTVAGAVTETGANASLIFVPAPFAADAMYEAIDAGLPTVICITEHVPAHEMLRLYEYIQPRGVRLIGPNCPGVLSPGKANAGIIPADLFAEGTIGLVSRSGTLTYQIGFELAELGLGNSSIVGIGGDPVVGSSFIDVLGLYEADPETDAVVLVGEIGGDEEERAAEFVAARMRKPVFAYIAGFSAPPGKTMGHAGAIISGSSGTAAAKKAALEAAGIAVGTTPTEVAQLVVARR
jgi:succinyl-CoA synthetase alpha subunit